MFDFDAGKLVIIGVVALIVIGPKDLPRVLRQVGQTVAKLRRMASDFQSQFMEAMREAELDDIRKDMASLNDVAKVRSFNPLDTVRRELNDALSDRKPAQVDYLPPVAEPDPLRPPETSTLGVDPVDEPLLPFPVAEDTSAAHPFTPASEPTALDPASASEAHGEVRVPGPAEDLNVRQHDDAHEADLAQADSRRFGGS